MKPLHGFPVRSTAALLSILVLGVAGVFLWQRSQIALLRAQVAQQGAVLADDRERLADLSVVLARPAVGRIEASSVRDRATLIPNADYNGAVLRADERRVILGQYRDVLAELQLPAATASRLKDLLTDRIESFLDAQDAARQQGFAEGSAETERAVALAISDDDREIASLLSRDADRRLNELLSVSTPEPAVMQADPAPVAVTVVVQEPPAPAYTDSNAQAAASYDDNPTPYFYYPYTGLYLARAPVRPFIPAKPAIARPRRSLVVSHARRS